MHNYETCTALHKFHILYISYGCYSKTELSKTDVCLINPYKPNGISHSYQLDESISNLRVVG